MVSKCLGNLLPRNLWWKVINSVRSISSFKWVVSTYQLVSISRYFPLETCHHWFLMPFFCGGGAWALNDRHTLSRSSIQYVYLFLYIWYQICSYMPCKWCEANIKWHTYINTQMLSLISLFKSFRFAFVKRIVSRLVARCGDFFVDRIQSEWTKSSQALDPWICFPGDFWSFLLWDALPFQTYFSGIVSEDAWFTSFIFLDERGHEFRWTLTFLLTKMCSIAESH